MSLDNPNNMVANAEVTKEFKVQGHNQPVAQPVSSLNQAIAETVTGTMKTSE